MCQQDKGNEKDKDSKHEEREILILPHELSLSFRAKKNNAPYLVGITNNDTNTSDNEQQEENINQEQDIVVLSHDDGFQERGNQSSDSLLSASFEPISLNSNAIHDGSDRHSLTLTSPDENSIQVIPFPLNNNNSNFTNGESIRSITDIVSPFKDDIYEQSLQSFRDLMRIKSDRKQSSTSSLYSPKSCPICMDDYEAGDEIVWSKNEHCYHAYHLDCIIGWLMERNDCPMCRRDYLLSLNTSHNGGDENNV